MKTPLEVASGIKPTGNTNDDVLLLTSTSKSHIARILRSLEDDGDISIIRDPWGRHEPGRILLNERVLKKPTQRDASK
jgi:hypothetical protein